jgi:hypothetical protein
MNGYLRGAMVYCSKGCTVNKEYMEGTSVKEPAAATESTEERQQNT